MDVLSRRMPSANRRICMHTICRPDAVSPSTVVFWEAVSSRCMGWGSNRAAKDLMSAAVMASGANSMMSPTLKSSKARMSRLVASGRKPEMHDVTIGDHVFLAFEAQPPGLAGARLAAERHIVVICDGLGADEAALEISMDDARRLGRLGAAGDGPGFRLLGSCREIREQAQKTVSGADQTIEPGLVESDGSQILGALGGRQHRDLSFDLGRDHHHAGAFLFGALLDPARKIVAGCGRGFVHIADVEHGLRRQEAEATERLVLLGLDRDEPRRLAIAQQGERAIDEVEGKLCLRVAPLHLLLKAVDASLQAVEVGEHQLSFDGVYVCDRVDPVTHVVDVGDLETANHMRNGVDLADHCDELVAKPLAPRGAADNPPDVPEREP